ncbi:8730_t:CDS:1, partial [Gigaspora margarita]
ILNYVIPNLKNDLVEFSIGFDGISPVELTSKSVLAILEHCQNIKKISLEGINLNDTDFDIENLSSSQLEHLQLDKTCHQNFTTK